jgi:ABC-2 type transport system permease protein
VASQAIDHPKLVIAAFVLKHNIASALLWGAIFGVIVASSALGYESSFTTPASQAQAAALGSNAGLQALLGIPHNIETVAGFTAWRSLGIVILLGAIWAILLATKNFRGEEEAGRWELLLSGQTTARRAVVQTFTGLAAALGAMYAVTAAITIATSRSLRVPFSAPDSLFLVLALMSVVCFFIAVGAFISQLAATRRQATTWTAAIFGICFVLRSIGNAGPSLDWVGWFSPLRWVDHLQPLTNPSPGWLLPLGLLSGVLITLTVYLAGVRDLGSGLIKGSDAALARKALLGNAFMASLRFLKASLLGWFIGISLFSYLFGTVSLTASQTFSDSSPLRKAISIVEGGANSEAKAFMGFIFIIVSTIMMVMAATQLSAAREEEAKGFLDNLLVRRVSRTSWLLGRVTLGIATFTITGIAAGIFAWLGVHAQNSGLSFDSMLLAGVNIVVPAILVLSIGVLTLGFIPRATSFIVYGVIVWSFLIEIIGSIIKSSDWLLNTSILHHLAAAPAVEPNWKSLAVMLALSLVLIAIGSLGFARRDLASD